MSHARARTTKRTYAHTCGGRRQRVISAFWPNKTCYLGAWLAISTNVVGRMQFSGAVKANTKAESKRTEWCARPVFFFLLFSEAFTLLVMSVVHQKRTAGKPTFCGDGDDFVGGVKKKLVAIAPA